MYFFRTSGAPLLSTRRELPLDSFTYASTDILFKVELNANFFIYVIFIFWGPYDSRRPAAFYVNLMPSKHCFSMGSPTIVPSVNAKVWAPPITIAVFLSYFNTFVNSCSSAYRLVLIPKPEIPLITKSFCVNVPVLSKQQIFILPARGILQGSVQNIYFCIN